MKNLYLLLLAIFSSLPLFAQTAETAHKVFPNPTEDVVFVKLDVFAQAGDYNVQLMDLVGNAIQEQELNPQIQVDPVEFNMEQLPKGFYFIRIQGPIETTTIRILKE